MVNDVHRTIKIEDEYLEYSKALQDETIDEFILRKSYETSLSEDVKNILNEEIQKYVYEEENIEEVDAVVENVDNVTQDSEEVKKEEKEAATEAAV